MNKKEMQIYFKNKTKEKKRKKRIESFADELMKKLWK